MAAGGSADDIAGDETGAFAGCVGGAEGAWILAEALEADEGDSLPPDEKYARISASDLNVIHRDKLRVRFRGSENFQRTTRLLLLQVPGRWGADQGGLQSTECFAECSLELQPF